MNTHVPSFEVAVTVRTEEKGRAIVKTLKDPSHQCSFVVVKDIAKDGAYDAVCSLPPRSGLYNTSNPLGLFNADLAYHGRRHAAFPIDSR